MANLRFTASVHHESQAIVPVSNYPGLLVPPGVPAYEPIPVTFGRMSQLAPNKFPAPAGLTVATKEPSVKLQGQWKPSGTSPVTWQWQGGAMELAVTVAVYIIDKYRPVEKAFELILSHELMHVQDDIDIVSQYLPQELQKDPLVKKYLIDQAPVDDSMYRNYFCTDMIQKNLQQTWADERNLRGGRRDSGALYRRYTEKLVKLLPTI
jgi:hypothetical protein